MAESVSSSAFAPACAIATLLVVAAPITAQRPTLRVEAGAAAVIIEGVDAGGAAFPMRTIERLGGWILDETAAGGRAVLLGDTLLFTPASAFFRADGVLQPLTNPVRADGDVLLIPEQFFVEWLPARHPTRLAWTDGALRSTAGVAEPSAGAPGVGAAATQPPTSSDAPEASRATPLVIIDAGHGGKDTGKVGPNGLQEKDATLAIATRLATALEARGYETRLTRTTDTLIALADRPALANHWRAGRPAIFLSIHANAFTSARVKGFETFFLSDARTDDERRVAEMENASSSYEDRPVANSEVDLILNDIRNDFYVRASSDLADAVQDRIASFHTGPNRGVKRAGFRVLVGALMPAVLVEVAFISNPEEARLLKTAAFQKKLVEGIGDAVDGFFARNRHLWAAGGGTGGTPR